MRTHQIKASVTSNRQYLEFKYPAILVFSHSEPTPCIRCALCQVLNVPVKFDLDYYNRLTKKKTFTFEFLTILNSTLFSKHKVNQVRPSQDMSAGKDPELKIELY